MQVLGKEVEIGSRVSFQTFNQIDKQVYRGSIIGFSDYQAARVHEELTAIHNSMPAEIAKLTLVSQTFLLVKTQDGLIRPFALCWIDSSTFKLIDTAQDRVIVVRNVPEGELDLILNSIRSLGYEAAMYRP